MPTSRKHFHAREDTVRLWRSDFTNGGIDALKASIASGLVPVKADAALRVAGPLLAAPVANRTNWTLARLAEEIQRQEGIAISRSQLSKVLRKKGVPLAPAAAHAEGQADCR